MKSLTKLTIGLITVGLISCAKVVLVNAKPQNPITYGATNISQVSTAEDNTFPDFEVEVERSQPIAQQTSPTLEEAWPYDNNFVVYEWLRSDASKLYSHALEIQLAGNKLSLYNTHLSEPLGQNVRCGGFGCDLATGSLVATLTFERQGNLFVVREASERASFLQGAKCKITAHILECTSTQAPPRSANFPSIFRFYIAD